MTEMNAAQRENWESIAGPKWLRNEAALEASHLAVSTLLEAAADVRTGEALLEVGCGTGTLLGRWAELVGPEGFVTGVDISATMLGVARGRAPAGVVLVQADAQVQRFERAFDVVVSKFGVMFFADPVAAFANLRSALRPGGRVCFVCWAGLADNAHWRLALEIVSRHLGAPEPKPAHAAGPMAFADLDYLRGILRDAGFGDVVVRNARPDLPSGTLGEAVAIATSMGPAGSLISERAPGDTVVAAIRAEVEAAFRPYVRGDGVYLPGSVHLVTAR